MLSTYFLCNLWIIMKLATILVILATSAHAQTCESPTCYINGTSEIHVPCRTCPVGEGVAVENRDLLFCSSSPPRDTKCEPCVAGVNFSDTDDLRQCLECRRCRSDKEDQTKECTADSDRECICKEGLFYYDDGSESCIDCTRCGENQEEIKPCTPTQNRECINKSTTDTLPTSTHHPITNQTTTSVGSHSPANTGMSLKGGNKDSKLLWLIALVPVIGIIIIVSWCVWKNREAICTRQDSGDGGPFICNCCIGIQTNRYNADATPPSTISGAMNGHATQYHEVPSQESRPNGVSREQSHATTSTTEAMELQQYPVHTLAFSQETYERLIRDLDGHDPLGRNALKLAYENLEMSEDVCSRLESSSSQASDVLNIWVVQRKTEDELIQALGKMGRNDITNYLEEDLTGS